MKIGKIAFASFFFILVAVGFALAAGGGGGSSPGGGSSGGGGGQGSGGVSGVTASLFSQSEITLFIQSGAVDQLILANQTQYPMTIAEIKTDSIIFTVNGKNFSVTQNEATGIDFDKDNVPDVLMTATYIQSGAGSGYVKITNAPKPGQNTQTPADQPKNITPTKSTLEAKLKCSDFSTVKERVRCRLGLKPEELDRELKLNYLPEQCRAKQAGADRDDCIKLYLNIRPCYGASKYDDREICARKYLKLSDLKQEKEQCAGMNKTEKSACVDGLRKKVDNLILFKLYELEYRAEYLMKGGSLSNETVVDFDSAVELKKQEYSQATNFGQKKKIVADVRNLWNDLLKKADLSKEKGDGGNKSGK